jgi:hypothetical protein
LEEEKRFEDMWGKRNASNNEPFLASRLVHCGKVASLR